MGILQHFPKHLTPRPEQAELLLKLEAAWNTYDTFSIIAPTATGKTEIMVTIAKWRESLDESSNILPPNNMLVEQTQARYPWLTTLHRRDAYTCKDMQMSCKDHLETVGNPCKGCVYNKARRETQKSRIRLMNYYTYFANNSGTAKRFGDVYATNVIFDEAHQLLEMLGDMADIGLWQSEYQFPDGLRTTADVIEWLQERLKEGPEAKLSDALRQIRLVKHSALVVYRESNKRGKADVMLHVIPASASSVPPWLWPAHRVKKIVLLSATLSQHDISELGLDKRRVAYLECGSPIPPARRPVKYQPIYNLGAERTEYALPLVIQTINDLLARHPQKGLIHLPYALAEQVRDKLTDPRLMFHSKFNKQEALDQFRAAPTESGRVLVASGLYEGVDLPYDAARWQLIGKVPFLSFGDPRIARKAAEDPDWYAWEAIKRVLQAAGRIVRAPDDEGVTYIHDSNFGRLWDRDKHRHVPLFPQFFRDALVDLRKR